MTAPPATGTPRLPLRDVVVLIFLGGTVGTLARWALAEMLGDPGGLSAGVALANFLGALGMGVLVGRLPRLDLSPLRRQRLRALLGTGILGGFTTYSALAVHCADLVRESDLDRAVIQGLASVLIGVVAAGVGLGLGAGGGPAPGEPHPDGPGEVTRG